MFDKADALREVGAGLQCGANALKVFQYLEVDQQLRDLAVAPKAIEFRDGLNSDLLYKVPLGEHYLKQFGAPYLHLHRADLVRVLSSAVRENPSIDLHLNASVEYLDIGTQKTKIKLADGREFSSKLVIGADGIRSKVRESVTPEVTPRFTGNVAWRALIPSAQLPNEYMDEVVTNYVGSRKHLVMYYVSGGQWLNIVAVVEDKAWSNPSWTKEASWSELRDAFKGWCPKVTAAIELLEHQPCFKWALYDLSPFTPWTHKTVTLVGDAAHATLPFMASGAAMAIEDARMLDRCLNIADTQNQALDLYQRNRYKRTSRIQKTSRRFGSLYHIPQRNLLRGAFKSLSLLGGKKEDFLPEYDVNTVVIK